MVLQFVQPDDHFDEARRPNGLEHLQFVIKALKLTVGMSPSTSIDVSFESRETVILGTEYAEEMKKGVYDLELLDAKARPAVHALLDRRIGTLGYGLEGGRG